MSLFTPENPAVLSEQLRRGRTPDLRLRRGIIGLAFAAGACTALVALYQSGVIRHVPEPRWRRLDADRVDAVNDAYAYFSTPDAFLGTVSYATTAALAAMGGADRARRRPWVSLAMVGKIILDCGIASWLTWFQWNRLRAFCSWCLLATSAAFATLLLALPEARRALRNLRRLPGARNRR
jgi:hypothetical protein